MARNVALAILVGLTLLLAVVSTAQYINERRQCADGVVVKDYVGFPRCVRMPGVRHG